MTNSFFERLTGPLLEEKEGPGKTQAADAEAPKQKRTYRQRQKVVLVNREEPGGKTDHYNNEMPKTLNDNDDAAPAPEYANLSKEVPSDIYPSLLQESSEDDKEGQLMLDVYDGSGHLNVYATVAGVRPEDIDISVVDGLITIRGFRRSAHEESDDRYYAKELYWGRFSRTVNLPDEVDGEKVEALLKNGLLTLKIPKKTPQSVKKIKVKSE